MSKQINKKQKLEKRGKVMWVFIYFVAFLVAFGVGIVSKIMPRSWAKDYPQR